MIKGIKGIKGIILSILIVYFYFTTITPTFSSAFASQPEDSEAIRAMMAAEQSVGKQIVDYVFTDQDGNRFHLKDLYNKPLIISFVYTNCPHTCSTITASLAAAVKEIENPQPPLNPPLLKGERGGFDVMTIGFDYERDTPERMLEFGKRFTNDFSHWKFVTADRDTIERFSRDIGFYYTKRGNDFSHLNMISMIAGGKVYQHIYGVNIKSSDIVTPLNELLTKRSEGKRLANPIGWRDRLITMCSLYDESTQTYRINYYYIIRFFLELMSLAAIFFFMWKREVYSLYTRVMMTMVRIKRRGYA
ncbi:MAG: SCO family protein [Nitrospirae bacterium]|nr:SCO family protein [Nitrospirota bacterium]